MPNVSGPGIRITADLAGIKAMHVDMFNKDAAAAGSAISVVDTRHRTGPTSHPIAGSPR
jgi:hypothetical protein